MGNVTLSNTFVNATVADADEVNENFTDITDVINGNIDENNIKSTTALTVASISIDTISEKTAAAGVTIDGTLIKDGGATMTSATLTTPVINTSITGTAIATGAEVTTGTDNTQIVTPKAIGDAGVNTRLQSKVTTSTRDLSAGSGDVSYTTVGFKPTAIIAMASITGEWIQGWGVCDSSLTEMSSDVAPEGAIVSTSTFLTLQDAAGALQTCIVKSFDTDGFTLTWTKTGSPVGTITLIFLCFR